MPGAAGNRKILIIDDEPSVADTLALIFTARGYRCRVAYAAETAIEILAEWPPDLAIVDVMLPLMNGIDFAIVLLANYPACRVVLFSGQPDTGRLLEEADKKGYHFEVLAKPLHPSLILDTVNNLLFACKERPAEA
jgi:DNA-binding NtrC family response regulator